MSPWEHGSPPLETPKLYRSKWGVINAACMRGQELSELNRAMHILLHTEDFRVRRTEYYGKLAIQAAGRTHANPPRQSSFYNKLFVQNAPGTKLEDLSPTPKTFHASWGALLPYTYSVATTYRIAMLCTVGLYVYRLRRYYNRVFPTADTPSTFFCRKTTRQHVRNKTVSPRLNRHDIESASISPSIDHSLRVVS